MVAWKYAIELMVPIFMGRAIKTILFGSRKYIGEPNFSYWILFLNGGTIGHVIYTSHEWAFVKSYPRCYCFTSIEAV